MKHNKSIIRKVLSDPKIRFTFLLSFICSIIVSLANSVQIKIIPIMIQNYQNILKFAIIYLGVSIVNATLDGFDFRWRLDNEIKRSMEKAYQKRICESDYGMFEKLGAPLINSTVQNMYDATQCILLSTDMIERFIKFLIYFIFVYYSIGNQILYLILLYCIFSVPMVLSTKKYYAKESNIQAEKLKELKKYDYDAREGYRELRSIHGLSKLYKKKLMNVIDEYRDSRNMVLKEDSKFNVFVNCAYSITTLLAAFLVIQKVKIGAITISDAIGTVVLIQLAFNPFMDTICTIPRILSLKVAVDQINTFFRYEDNVLDGDIHLTNFLDKIEFKNVSFFYDSSNNVLNDISFKVKKGEHIGICGHTGSGKSTITKLLMRFYDCTEGKIMIDGIDIKKLKKDSLLKHIGIIHQDTFLFDGTIAENIAIGLPDKENVSMDLIIEASKKARLHDFVMSLTDGYDSLVGARGMKLSGGQQQRVALARVFIANPDIIIMDEATSALDTETEKLVQESIKEFKDKTMITIAHRLSTIRDSDKIIVIENHEIAEQGTHDDLLKKDGVYSNLYNLLLESD